MPPSIHPVDLISALRQKHLTPAIVFLTSRRACDEAMEAFDHANCVLPTTRQEAIAKALEQVMAHHPSIAEHPLIPIVQRIGVAAHHAGHLPTWKIAIEELMRQGHLDAVFATTTLAAGVDFPARTVVITQSSIRKSRDFTDLTAGEVQQIAGRAGRRGKDHVGFAVITPSPYIDLSVLTKGLTGQPEAIDSQFTISYPMVLNLLKAHPHEHIQGILAKSFAQFQLNQRAEVLEQKLDALHIKMEPFGPRVCTDWITQWHTFDHARRHRHTRHPTYRAEPPEISARLPFLTPGRVVGFSRGRGIVLRQYQSKGQRNSMLTVLRPESAVTECPVTSVKEVYDRTYDCPETSAYPWCSTDTFDRLSHQLDELPLRLPLLPILVSSHNEPLPDAIVQSLEDFSCPTCPSRSACQKDFLTASRLRQEQQRHTKSIQALRTSLWHRFQERVEVLQKFGYLTLATQLTAEGEWARLIRIDHSLLITELIRAEAFTGADPSLLAGILASLAHDDDRPGAFPRISPGLSSLLGQVRKLAESLSPYEDPPLLRADVAALVERWVADQTLTWIGLCRLTTMAEGDIYRLLARTLEYLSQVQTLKGTHPGLAESASQAITAIRRGVLEELP
ncbi:putative Helicase (C-terminal) [Candidatus Nitrospira nitrosa]|uniref:Putative Helicase (C-terminal) n=1 Tax=Candidatus Nitrospira nitrosa TaxID=1742972 RepID=A0A0S4LMD7_9BACT|nr:helicase-related protein [Candidatus Nitrospira nitrosa]CUS38737.1 putative Helicase (C-terminal) [Candidatus Nitrospira nitrosa]